MAELCERQDELQQAGVVAVSWMSYLDSPGADGYFNAAEKHKGLKYSVAMAADCQTLLGSRLVM